MSYPGVFDPGWYERDPEELVEYVDVDDLEEEAYNLLRPDIRRLVIGRWAQEWVRRYLEARVWEGLTGEEPEEASQLFTCLVPMYLSADALEELGDDAQIRAEQIEMGG
jgi:hypothetical protein